MRYHIYIYREPDGTPFYVGKGHGRRAKYHLSACRREKSFFYNKLRKMLDAGIEPSIEIYARGLDEEAAFALERELIARYGRRYIGTGTLCNLTDGGEGRSGYKYTDKQRAKHTEAMRRLSQNPEWRAKNAEAHRRRSRDPEWHAKMQSVYQNPEWRAKIAESCRQRSQDPEWRAKNAEACRQRSQDPEWQAKMRQLRQSPEWRAKNAEVGRRNSRDPEWHAKMQSVYQSPEWRAKMQSVYQSPEWRAKNAEAHRRRSEQHRAKIQPLIDWAVAMRQLGLSLRAIADKMGISKATVNKYLKLADTMSAQPSPP